MYYHGVALLFVWNLDLKVGFTNATGGAPPMSWYNSLLMPSNNLFY